MRNLIRKNVLQMAGYVPGEQPRVRGLIKLNTNENPYPPSPKVGEIPAKYDMARLRLYPDPVSTGLRDKIAEYHGCDISRIFAGNGSDEILALCTRAFVENDGAIGYFEPSYSLYPVLADIRDVEKRPVQLGRDFEWQMPAGYGCSLFFLTLPNAPTGILYPAETVAAFCRNFAGVVLIDEAYVDFSSRNCMDLALECDNVLVMRTLSKSFSLAGLRMGYVIGHPDLTGALFKIKDSYNMDALTQVLATAALSDIGHMRSNVAKIKATRKRLTGELEDMGFRVYPSEANFVWVKPSREGAEQLFERLRERRVLVRYFKGPRTGECIRVTVGTDEEINVLLEEIRRGI